MTDLAGTESVADRPVTRTGVPRTRAPSPLVTTGVTVARDVTLPKRERSRVTERAEVPLFTCTTVAVRPFCCTAATLDGSSTFTKWSPGRMWWVKFRMVWNLVLVRIGQVSRVSSAVQLNGTWMLPQFLPAAACGTASSTGCQNTQAEGSSSRMSSTIRVAMPSPGSIPVKSVPVPQVPSTSLIHSFLAAPLAMSRALVRWPVP